MNTGSPLGLLELRLIAAAGDAMSSARLDLRAWLTIGGIRRELINPGVTLAQLKERIAAERRLREPERA